MALIGISIVIATLSFILYRTNFQSWPFTRALKLEEQDQRQQESDAQEKRRRSDDTAIHDEKSGPGQGSEGNVDVSPLKVYEEADNDEEDDPTTPTATTNSTPFILPRITGSESNRTSTKPSLVIRDTELSAATLKNSQDMPQLHDNTRAPARLSSSGTTSPSTLMPPPPRPRPTAPLPSVSQRTPQSTSSLRVPGSGPLPACNPTSSSSSLMPPPSSASLSRSLPRASPNTSTLNPTSLTASTLPTQKRKKVVLSPGHSPIDWAHLIRTSPSTTLTGLPPGRQLRISPSQLALHNGRKGAPTWSAWQGKVYNIGPYMPFHPGGEGELMRCAGKQGSVVEKMFMEVHPWVNWENMLGSCVVGVLVAEGEGDELVVEDKQEPKSSSNASTIKSELDDMD